MSLKILLADDSVTAQNMGKKILSDAGYEVVAVSNGSAALKKIPEIKPDLVILDIYMPGYSGLEVCQKIKEARQTASVPVLLTVGKLEPFKARDASRVRADGFIVKPFEATELLATIKRIIGTMGESPRGKGKNGEESKSRVKQAREASQAASAEQLASTLRDVLPRNEKFEPEAAEGNGERDDYGARSPEVRDEEPREGFSVRQDPEAGAEVDENTYATPEGTAKFRVDVHRKPGAEEDMRFTASSFETWEKSRGEPPRESRGDALERIRAAREAEASERGDREWPQAEPAQPAAFQETQTLPEQGPAESVEAVTSGERETAVKGGPQYREQGEEPSSVAEQPAAGFSEVPVASAEPVSSDKEWPRESHGPISGLADWAADLHEDTAAAPQSSSMEVSSKWIAEEVPLGSGDSGVALSEEMRRFQAGPAEVNVEEASAVEQGEASEVVPQQVQQTEMPEPYAAGDSAEPVQAESEPASVEAQAEPAPAEAETQPAAQPENAEAVAALAKAAAAAAMSSISEIREAVLASAAAAGVSSSAVVESHVVEQPTEPAPSVDISQFAAQPPSSPVEDVQGATIAAVTKEVAESAPADLNSDAIASIVNRVIEQMKPKLVAEIAKELTHKKDE